MISSYLEFYNYFLNFKNKDCLIFTNQKVINRGKLLYGEIMVTLLNPPLKGKKQQIFALAM